MKIFGLTGNMATGKTTLAKILHQKKIPVFEADKQVKFLQNQSQAIRTLLAEKGLVADADKPIPSQQMRELILKSPHLLKELEAIYHPAVHILEKKFIRQAYRQRRKVIFLDIPLLFEVAEYQACFDAIFLSYVPPSIQKQRAFKRKNMTAEWFSFIDSRQLPSRWKMKYSQAVITTGLTLRDSRWQFLSKLKAFLSQKPSYQKHP